MTSDRSRHSLDERPSDEHPLPDQDTWVLIADYVSGSATSEQRAAVEARRQTDAAFAEHVAAARLVWQHGTAAGAGVAGTDPDVAWRRLAAAIDEGAINGPGTETPRTSRARPALDLRRRSRRRGWGMAAVAASVVAITAVGLTFGTDLVFDRTQAGADRLVDTVADRGKRVEVTLPDGTRLMLAPGTTLRAPEHFTGDVRRVVLSGRAYFDVAHDAARPFLVETDNVVVRVLGTRFDLRAYPGAADAEVIVRDGRVAVRSPADRTGADNRIAAADRAGAGNRAGASRSADTDADYGTVLEAGDRGTVSAAGDITVAEGVAVDALLSWMDGRLVFERAPLAEVIADIERWHDVTIELADAELGHLRLTAAFDRESLDIVLETVAQLVDAQATREGRHVVISRAVRGR